MESKSLTVQGDVNEMDIIAVVLTPTSRLRVLKKCHIPVINSRDSFRLSSDGGKILGEVMTDLGNGTSKEHR